MTSEEVVEQEDEGLSDYELVFIVSPEIAEENLEATINTVNQFISGQGGIISDVEQWGKRRLAYPIKHFEEGNYVLARFKLKPGQNRELETNLKISEDIIRHLLIKLG
jgi:small subunit ribosomal protein S6